MSDAQVSLEEWVKVAAKSIPANERELLWIFQKDWMEGAMQNPLLYPLNQPTADWQESYDWFHTFETFNMPQDASLKTEDEPVSTYDDEETVVFDPAAADPDMKTVILDQSQVPSSTGLPSSPPSSVNGEDIISEELSDLDTLIMEETVQDATKSMQPIAPSPPEPPEFPPEQNESGTLQDDYVGELDDLDTLIMNSETQSSSKVGEYDPSGSQPPGVFPKAQSSTKIRTSTEGQPKGAGEKEGKVTVVSQENGKKEKRSQAQVETKKASPTGIKDLGEPKTTKRKAKDAPTSTDKLSPLGKTAVSKTKTSTRLTGQESKSLEKESSEPPSAASEIIMKNQEGNETLPFDVASASETNVADEMEIDLKDLVENFTDESEPVQTSGTDASEAPNDREKQIGDLELDLEDLDTMKWHND